MARIVGVETFFAEDVALVRVRTEDGYEGWGLDVTGGEQDCLLSTWRRLNDTFGALRAGNGAHSVLILD